MPEQLILLETLSGAWVAWCADKKCVVPLDENPSYPLPNRDAWEDYCATFNKTMGDGAGVGFRHEPDVFVVDKIEGRWRISAYAPPSLISYAIRCGWDTKGLVIVEVMNSY